VGLGVSLLGYYAYTEIYSGACTKVLGADLPPDNVPAPKLPDRVG